MDLPEPITRKEMYLNAIARNGGGGGGGGGGSSTLSGLTDVDLTNPTDGQTLVYDAESQKWVNGSDGGGVLVVHQVYNEQDDVVTLEKTAGEIYAALANKMIVLVWENAEDTDITSSPIIHCTFYDGYKFMVPSFNYIGGAYTANILVYTANSANDYPSLD